MTDIRTEIVKYGTIITPDEINVLGRVSEGILEDVGSETRVTYIGHLLTKDNEIGWTVGVVYSKKSQEVLIYYEIHNHPEFGYEMTIDYSEYEVNGKLYPAELCRTVDFMARQIEKVIPVLGEPIDIEEERAIIWNMEHTDMQKNILLNGPDGKTKDDRLQALFGKK